MKTLILLVILALIPTSLFAQNSLDSSFSTVNEKQLTDQQVNDSKTFVHQGVRDKKIEEGCKTIDKCDPNAAANKGVILPGIIENNIGKLYAVVFGGLDFLTGKGGPSVTVKDKTAGVAKGTPPAAKEKLPGAAAKDGTTTKPDYCIYPAIGSEVLIGMMQANMQQQAQQGSANLDPQLQALVNLKETHKARKKTSMLQSAVYAGTSACYIARAAVSGGAVVMDAKYIAKMTAAGGIAVLYGLKAKKHQAAADKVQKVIDSLPKEGSCNPWTGTTCFCAESTSKTLYPSQYQEVCVLNGGNPNGTVANVGCGKLVNGQMTLDPTCTCKSNNTCFTANVSGFNPNFNLGKNFQDLANKGFNLANSGTYDEAQLRDYTTSARAQAGKIESKLDTSGLPKVNLTDEQKKIADGLDEFVPDGTAALAAVAPDAGPPGGGLMGGSTASALEKVPEQLKKDLAESVSGKYSSRGGGGDGGGSPEQISLPGFGGPEGKKEGEVVSFADKALESDGADVANIPETPIFDIISNRYRRSAWEKFSIDR